MQVESLEVQRRPSYDSDYPNQLVGLVTLKSNLGSQQIKISNRGLAQILLLANCRSGTCVLRGALVLALNEGYCHDRHLPRSFARIVR